MKQLVKRIFLCVCAFAMILSCGTVFAQAAEGDLDIGQMEIVLPAEATDVEKTAAEELALYVNKMTGQTMTTVTEGKQTGNAVYVGATQFATENEVTFEDNEFGEGWAIKAVDGNLVLTGGTVRGSLYAVYHLLEDVFGVRWWNPWEEYVPELSAALVPADYNDSGVPDFLYRDIYVNETWEYLYFVRNRVNGWVTNTPQAYGGEESFGAPDHTHTIGIFFPGYYQDNAKYQEWIDAVGNPDHVDFFEEHPEWFQLSKSSGTRSPNGHLCLTSEGLREAYAEKMLATIQYSYDKADAENVVRPHYFAIAPIDQGGSCGCEDCEASIAEHGLSGNLLSFVNYVADAVAEVYPEVFIETLAYWNYLEAPLDDTKPADNVVIRFADNSMDLLHDMNHVNNERFKTQLEAWTKITKPGNLYVWDYAVIYPTNGVFPSMYKYGTNLKTFKEWGINGYFVEHENASSVDFWDMKLWLMSKLMEDADQDYDALMNEFIYGYYGEAAGPYIRQYLDYMHGEAEACKTGYKFGDDIINNTWLDVADILQGHAYFDQAFAAVGDDEVLLKRLRIARSGLDKLTADNYILWQMKAEYQEIEWTIDQKELLERAILTLTELIEQRGGTYLYNIDNALEKYKLDLRLMPGYEEPATEETVEQTEPPVTEEPVVPETTEPVVVDNTEHNNALWIVVGIAAGVIVIVGVVLLRKKAKK